MTNNNSTYFFTRIGGKSRFGDFAIYKHVIKNSLYNKQNI